MAKKKRALLAELEHAIALAQHAQDDAAKAPRLTTWTAYGNVEEDAIGPLAGRPIETLRLYRTRATAPLDGLARLPALRALFIEEPDVSAERILEAAAAAPKLEVLVLRPAHERSGEALTAQAVARLAALKGVELRNVTIAGGLDALFAGRALEDVALSGLRGLEALTIEDQPALRHVHLVVEGKRLRLARLPALEEAVLGGGFDAIEIEALPALEELELPIADRATIRDVGARRVIVVGLSSLDLDGAGALEELDLESAIDTLPPDRVEALRRRFPDARVRPAAKAATTKRAAPPKKQAAAKQAAAKAKKQGAAKPSKTAVTKPAKRSAKKPATKATKRPTKR